MAGTTTISHPGREIHDSKAARAPRSTWIVSPAFDLLFLANAWWLAALLPGFLSTERTPHIEFWQIYFLTTPHRWITLFLVATDPDRRAGRRGLFLAIAVVMAVAVCTVRLTTGGFLCLFLVDYLWNSWHFAAQHAGILRMYARKTEWGHPRLETWALRTLVCYTSLRLAGWSTGWSEGWPSAQFGLTALDVAVTIPTLLLLTIELVHAPQRRPGKVAYLVSVATLYMSLLAAVSLGGTTLVLSLTAAAAAFHAIEYMAVVTHYAQRRREQGTRGLFSSMARSWAMILASYVVLFGLLARWADTFVHEFWLGINLWAAGLHYAYDGLIWKLRTPQTAQALDVELPRGKADRSGPADPHSQTVAPAAVEPALATAER
ncbi:MAG TPA: hypothetical protein VGN12_09115 [Pirellulales bacterium]|jgi:hypothetical protein